MVPTQVAPAALCEQPEHHLLLHRDCTGLESVVDAAILEQSAWNRLSWNCRHQMGMTHNLPIEIPYVLEMFLFPFELLELFPKNPVCFEFI